MKKSLLLIVSTALFTACSPDISSHDTLIAESDSAVIGGQAITERVTEAARSVILVEMTNRWGQSLGFCTGTLIGPHSALTAGHCFDKQRLPTLSGVNIIFTNKKYSMYQRAQAQRHGVDWKIHPNYNSTRKFFDHDIAVVRFDGTIPDGFNPVAFDTDPQADYSNEEVYVYGYGRSKDYTGKRNQDIYAYLGQLHRGILKINSLYHRAEDRYWTVPGAETSICQGDSGGPQFYHKAGVLKIIGVNSAVLGPKLPNGQYSCKGVTQATKVGAASGWIIETIRN
ncbi:trypsin-like serine protease [Bdellovibrio sp. ArHS]|uniref:S1 family peptidase n=1 Tax=Bdellovibrio sp. ArHS TaxID=1569284 RepID=UPI000A6C9430|nr:trypsin-like serine protease [Bdellovibrio sp. ArHS]